MKKVEQEGKNGRILGDLYRFLSMSKMNQLFNHSKSKCPGMKNVERDEKNKIEDI